MFFFTHSVNSELGLAVITVTHLFFTRSIFCSSLLSSYPSLSLSWVVVLGHGVPLQTFACVACLTFIQIQRNGSVHLTRVSEQINFMDRVVPKWPHFGGSGLRWLDVNNVIMLFYNHANIQQIRYYWYNLWSNIKCMGMVILEIVIAHVLT